MFYLIIYEDFSKEYYQDIFFFNGHTDFFFETFETSAISITSSLNFEMDTFDMPNCSSMMISGISANFARVKFSTSFI